MPPAAAGNQAAQIRAHLFALLEPLVVSEGYDLEEITVTAAGRRNLIRVVVDADGGIDLDAVAAISRAMSETLDAAEGGPDFADPYVLEVSSPGVDRPLTEPRHWRRAVGRLVETQHSGRPVTGRVLVATEAGVTVEVSTGRGKTTKSEIPYAELGTGKVQVEFSRSAKTAPDDEIDDVDFDEEED